METGWSRDLSKESVRAPDHMTVSPTTQIPEESVLFGVRLVAYGEINRFNSSIPSMEESKPDVIFYFSVLYRVPLSYSEL
jgi:hypothetical protein